MSSPERVASIQARALCTPFRMSFRHASAERSVMQSLWVTVRSGDGLRGDGEGCPREYVTFETLQSSLDFVQACRAEWIAALHDVDSLRFWTDANRALVDRHPAAWCAVELAMLDLFGRRARVPVEHLVGEATLPDRFRYTAVLGDATDDAFEALLARYLAAKFCAFKVKLSGRAAADLAKVRALRAAGVDPAHVRADANNRWRDAREAIAGLRALDYPFAAIEEPLAAGDIDGARALAQALGTRIVLDESVTRLGHLEALAADADRWIVNTRVSKMGGLLRSLALVRRARALGMDVVVGAHVGETSLLTRAALTVAAAAGDRLVAQEGAFGTQLLENDITAAPLMFGAGGVLDAAPLAGSPGLGVEIRA